MIINSPKKVEKESVMILNNTIYQRNNQWLLLGDNKLMLEMHLRITKCIYISFSCTIF